MKDGDVLSTINKNKLKFQLILFLKKNIAQLFIIAMFSCNLALSNESMIFQIKNGYNGGIDYKFWILLLLLIIYTYLSKVYEETSAYFTSIGYTRNSYYQGTMIVSLILSIVTTTITLLAYMLSIIASELYKDYDVIPYMGFYFNGFTIKSCIAIMVVTFSIMTLICAIANFISVITFSNRIFKIVVSVIILTPMLLILFNISYGSNIEKLIFSIDKSFNLTILLYFLISILLYILGKKVFMKIDIN